MTTAAITKQDDNATILENLIVNGDLSGLSPKQRVQYYMQTCQSLGLNPYTKPFAYIRLNNKLTLYALKDTTDQLRKVNAVSIISMDSKVVTDVYVVTVGAKDKDGRQDTSTGVVNIKGLAGENLANAMMKAETKAKRRVTLSICGLGMLDETEIETIKDVEPVKVTDTGEIVESEKEPIKPISNNAKPVDASTAFWMYCKANGIDQAGGQEIIKKAGSIVDALQLAQETISGNQSA